MQYDIPLPREVVGTELIEALKRVASRNGWEYEDDVIALSVYPISGSVDVAPKTLDVAIDPNQRMLGIFRDIGKIELRVDLDEKYLAIIVNPARPRHVDGIQGVDRVTKTTLETFVKSLYQELR